MIWKILRFATQGTVLLPHRLTHLTMHPFIGDVLDENGESKWSLVNFDFSRLDFIDPTGVVVASNLIDYLREAGVKVKFRINMGEEEKDVAVKLVKVETLLDEELEEYFYSLPLPDDTQCGIGSFRAKYLKM